MHFFLNTVKVKRFSSIAKGNWSPGPCSAAVLRFSESRSEEKVCGATFDVAPKSVTKVIQSNQSRVTIDGKKHPTPTSGTFYRPKVEFVMLVK